jgi:hypothetical protein
MVSVGKILEKPFIWIGEVFWMSLLDEAWRLLLHSPIKHHTAHPFSPCLFAWMSEHSYRQKIPVKGIKMTIPNTI